MDRIQADAAATVQVTVYDADGEATDVDGDVTVQIDDDLGNEVVAATTATKVADETGVYEHDLTAADIPDPTELVVTWTATVDGSAWKHTERVDVAGGRYIRLGELRSRRTSISTYPTATLRRGIAKIENRIDKATNAMWVPRYTRRTILGSGGTILDLPHRDIRELVQVTVDGDTVTTSDWDIRPTGVIDMDVSYDRDQPVEVAYRHGRDAPPADLADAALDAADVAASQHVNDARRGMSDYPEGGFPFQLASYEHDRPFGIDGVDAVVVSHRQPAVA